MRVQLSNPQLAYHGRVGQVSLHNELNGTTEIGVKFSRGSQHPVWFLPETLVHTDKPRDWDSES